MVRRDRVNELLAIHKEQEERESIFSDLRSLLDTCSDENTGLERIASSTCDEQERIQLHHNELT
jgi:hypothetical protein